MTLTSLRLWIAKNEALAIVAIAFALVASLYTFEATTGLPASVRSGQTYNTLTLPRLRPAVRKTVKKPSLKEQRRVQRIKASSAQSTR